MMVVGGDANVVILSYNNNNTYYTGGNMDNHSSEITCHDNFNILCRINDVMQDIICLKNMNRSIGQRMKALGGEVTKLTLHIAKTTTNNKGNLRKRHSYCNLIRILEDLQNRNSRLILKHRNEIQQLRKELV